MTRASFKASEHTVNNFVTGAIRRKFKPAQGHGGGAYGSAAAGHNAYAHGRRRNVDSSAPS